MLRSGAAMCPVLTRCSDDVVWTQVGPQGMDYAGTFRAKGVGRWFGMVAANDVIREFEPREFSAAMITAR